jgi:hypothetical protein
MYDFYYAVVVSEDKKPLAILKLSDRADGKVDILYDEHPFSENMIYHIKKVRKGDAKKFDPVSLYFFLESPSVGFYVDKEIAESLKSI